MPVVYLTAHADDATLERAKQTKPYGYPGQARQARGAAERDRDRALPPRRGAARSGPTRRVPPAAVALDSGRHAAPRAPAVRHQVEQILGNADFDAARRSRDFLCFIVEETLAGRGEDLTQGSIATRVFDRKDDFDALLDPIVRIQAGRLRRSLERYYLLAGKDDPVRIDLPKGAYVPTFTSRRGRGLRRPAREEATPGGLGPADAWPSITVSRFEVAAPDEGQAQVAAAHGRHAHGGARPLPRRTRRGATRPWRGPGPPRTAGAFRDRGTRPSTGRRLARQRPTRGSNQGRAALGRRVPHGLQSRGGGAVMLTTWPASSRRASPPRTGPSPGPSCGKTEGRPRPNAHPTPRSWAPITSSSAVTSRTSTPPSRPCRRRLPGSRRSAWPGRSWRDSTQVNHAFELSEMETPIDEAIGSPIGGALHPLSARTRCVLASPF